MEDPATNGPGRSTATAGPAPGPTATARPRPVVRVVVSVVAAFGYGLVTSQIPSPTDAASFWIGNLATPYLFIPFVAGAWQLRPVAAGITGSLAGSAIVAGFYNVFEVAIRTNSMMGLPLDTPDVERIGASYNLYFRTFLLGDPGGLPWLSFGLIAGAGCGVLGYAWHRRGSRLAGLLIALPFIVEPLVYALGMNARLFPTMPHALDTANVLIWGTELVIGLGLAAWFLLHGRTRPAGAG